MTTTLHLNVRNAVNLIKLTTFKMEQNIIKIVCFTQQYTVESAVHFVAELVIGDNNLNRLYT